MKAVYALSPAAKQDLKKIWRYSAKNWDTDQADLYLSNLYKSMQVLGARPSLGRACDKIRLGYYKYNSGSHCIFFRILDNGIDVIRILHERMDFRQYL
jgi:toxin ParE1/3/4